MEAYMYLCHPQIARGLEILNSGEIGELCHIASRFGFAAEFDPKSRLFDKALGGGGILDVGGYVRKSRLPSRERPALKSKSTHRCSMPLRQKRPRALFLTEKQRFLRLRCAGRTPLPWPGPLMLGDMVSGTSSTGNSDWLLRGDRWKDHTDLRAPHGRGPDLKTAFIKFGNIANDQ